MSWKEISRNKKFKVLVGIIFIFVIVLIIFQAGMYVGLRKARFSSRLGDNFERNFRDPRSGGFMQRSFPGGAGMPIGHGAVGEIVSIALPLIVVAGPDKLEKTVVVTKTTEVREFRNTVPANELAVGDFIIVLGTPNDEGQISAKLIRLAPSPRSDFREDKATQ